MQKKIKAEELDRLFDEGENIDEYIDWSSAKQINKEKKRVNVDFPGGMLRRLDAEAAKRGVTRQALIKMWLADRLDSAA